MNAHDGYDIAFSHQGDGLNSFCYQSAVGPAEAE